MGLDENEQEIYKFQDGTTIFNQIPFMRFLKDKFEVELCF